MATNAERKAAKRQQILHAAEKLFMRQGFKSTSISDIAKAARTSQVTLYKYFPTKQALGHQVVLHLVVDGYAGYQKMIDDPNLSFPDLIKQMMTGASGFTAAMNTDFYDYVVRDMQGEFGTSETMEAYQKGKFHFWQSMIDKGRAAGMVSANVSSDALLMYLDMFIQYVNNPANAAVYHRDPAKMQAMEDELIHLFFYGFIGQPGPDKLA